jgi:hypothetical protein
MARNEPVAESHSPGRKRTAQHAAATLLLIAPDRLWRRCGAAAFEEIGVADLQTVSLVTAALAGKGYRATLNGDWKVASFIIDRMTKAPKCRAADDRLLTADSHPRYQRARVELADKTTAELILFNQNSILKRRFKSYCCHCSGLAMFQRRNICLGSLGIQVGAPV